MTDTREDALLPCPFCGGEAELDKRQAYCNISTGRTEEAAAVYCLSCNVNVSFCYRDAPDIPHETIINDVVENWNKRTPSDAVAKLVEALKRFDAVTGVLSGGDDPVPGKPFDMGVIQDPSVYIEAVRAIRTALAPFAESK